jgi:hypothetical protein
MQEQIMPRLNELEKYFKIICKNTGVDKLGV